MKVHGATPFFLSRRSPPTAMAGFLTMDHLSAAWHEWLSVRWAGPVGGIPLLEDLP